MDMAVWQRQTQIKKRSTEEAPPWNGQYEHYLDNFGIDSSIAPSIQYRELNLLTNNLIKNLLLFEDDK